MKVLLTLRIQKTIDLPKVIIDEDDDDWPEKYLDKRDQVVKQIERLGWNVDVEAEDEE